MIKLKLINIFKLEVNRIVDPVYQSLKAAAEARRKPKPEASANNETASRQSAPIITHEKCSAPQSRSRSNASSSGSSPSYLLAVKTPLHAYSGLSDIYSSHYLINTFIEFS